MKLLKQHQRGAIDGMFIVLLVVLLAFGGFVAWRMVEANDEAADSNDAATAASDIIVSPNEDEVDSEEDATNDADESDSNDAESPSTTTYTNSEYGFSFEYPDSDKWSFKDAGDPLTEEELINSISVKYDCGPNCGLAFSVYATKTDTNTIQRLKDQFASNSTYSLSEERPFTFGEPVGTLLTFSADEGQTGAADVVYGVVGYQGATYTFTINANGATSDEIDVTAEGIAILESFRFN